MKPGYPECPCAACQKVMMAADGQRPPCENGHTFDANTGERNTPEPRPYPHGWWIAPMFVLSIFMWVGGYFVCRMLFRVVW